MDIYNREDNHWTVSLLDIDETSKVLEIGFGTGLAIADAAKIAKHGCVYGIDHSETMLKVAQKRNQSAVNSGHVRLQLGNVMALPFEDNYFDRANFRFWILENGIIFRFKPRHVRAEQI
jgi:ubiquinone/menaquinone biosynthesis C-methylase UbiE